MKNKGQALIIFVLLLPLFILGVAYIYDVSLITYEKNKIANIGDLALNYIENDEELTNEGIIQLINMNDKNIKVSINENNGFKIQLSKEIDSIFSKIVGKEKYVIKTIVEKK